jgi:hypothetical protein
MEEDFEKQEQRRREVFRGAETIGTSKFFGTQAGRVDLGLCNRCSNCSIAKTRYGNVLAECAWWEIRLTTNDPIEDCTQFSAKGEMSLMEMSQIAYHLDLEDIERESKREDAGFLARNKKKEDEDVDS